MEKNIYLEKFFEEFDYQEEAREAYRAVGIALERNPECKDKAQRATDMLFEKPQDVEGIIALLTDAAKGIGISAHTVKFYVLAVATEKLRELWRKGGTDDSVAYNSLRDFRFKSDECHMFAGVYGSFSDAWLIGWFRGDRFAFGRLQFEVTKLSYEEGITVGGKFFEKGSEVVGVHIPRSPDSFSPEARLASYKMAYEHFKSQFPEKEIPFTCGSWLLFPYNKEILSPTSNTVTFANEFKLMSWGRAEVWIRFIFGVLYKGNPDDLPENSSLHRGYKKYIKEGNMVGSGYGIFLFDGEKIINE